MRTPQHLYRINLAVADLLLGTFGFLPSVYLATKRFGSIATVNEKNNPLDNQVSMTTFESRTFERVVGFLCWLSFLVSIFTLVVASFDRLFATVFPVRYVKKDNCYVTIGACIMVWVLAVCNLTAFFDSTASVVTTPYFVRIEGTGSGLHALVGRLILLVSMVTNSSVVLLVLHFHNRFVNVTCLLTYFLVVKNVKFTKKIKLVM